MELQIVDFAKCSIQHKRVSHEDLQSVGKSIYEAFASLGFVYLSNTGISEEEAAGIHDLSKEFFLLDELTKRKYVIDADNFGYVAKGVENSDPCKPGEYKETFDISGTGLVSEKRWPDEEIDGFSSRMRSFMEKLRQLTMRILDALSAGMDLKDKKYFAKSHSRTNNVRNMSTLRTLYYPVIPKDYVVSEGELRLGEHSDWGSLTVLFQDSMGGLQVKRRDGVYIDATHIPGTALVNIGDALEFWTRGELKSTKHRVLMPDVDSEKNVERSSVVYFVRPDSEALMSEIEYKDCKRKDNVGEKSKPITALEYLQQKYREANMPVPTA